MTVPSKEDWLELANAECPKSEDSDGGCYFNTAESTGTPDVGDDICGAPESVGGDCSANVCICEIPCLRPPCFPVTKANFDIWNENEVKFSGVHRCIHSWDQTWLSRYDDDALVNQFWLPMMHTNKGKARINNHASTTVCGPDTIKAPLIGVAAKELFFDGGYERAGTALVGAGRGVGQILYDTIGPPPDDLHEGEEAPAATPSRVSATPPKGGAQARSIVGAGPRSGENDLVDDRTRRASVSVKGSLLVFPLIEILWNTGGEVIQDTFLDLTNDGVDDVMVKLYFVDGDGCVWANNVVTLTANEASYWSALTGEPAGASPFTVLPSRCLYTDSQGQRVRRLRGYILAFAVDPTTGEEIRWNHLKGDALILNYRDGTAWEYNAWAFQAAAADVAEGDLLLPPLGQLDLDGIEYDTPPDQLILDFYASGATLKSGLMNGVSVDTELILWVVNKDLRQDSQVP